MDWDEKETPAGHAEIFKLLHQSGNNANYVGVSWTSDLARRDLGIFWNAYVFQERAPVVYANDVIGSLIAADLVKKNFSGYPHLLGTNTTAVAHSLGNVLVSSLINDHGVKFGNYIMLNPAVPCEAYDGRALKNDPDRRNMTHPDWRGSATDGSGDYYEDNTAAGWNLLFSETDPRSLVTWDGRFASVLDKTEVWQFYSSGEEILRPASGVVPPLFLYPWESGDLSLMTREWIWVFHEITKGAMNRAYAYMAEIPRHRNAGWRFNSHYNNLLGFRMSPQDAAMLLVPDLIATPFFYRFDTDEHLHIPFWKMNGWENPNNSVDTSWLYKPDNDPDPSYRLPFLPLDVNDEWYMEKMKVHAKLLAEQIPPLSSPAGGKPLINLDQNHRFNLNDYSENNNLWLSTRPKKSGSQQRDKRWLHGDYKDAPYLLTHPLYRKINKISQGVSQ